MTARSATAATAGLRVAAGRGTSGAGGLRTRCVRRDGGRRDGRTESRPAAAALFAVEPKDPRTDPLAGGQRLQECEPHDVVEPMNHTPHTGRVVVEAPDPLALAPQRIEGLLPVLIDLVLLAAAATASGRSTTSGDSGANGSIHGHQAPGHRSGCATILLGLAAFVRSMRPGHG